MGNCRCESIDKCKRKMNKLNDIMNSLNVLDRPCAELYDVLENLSGNVIASYEATNLSAVRTKINSLDEDIYAVKNDFKNTLQIKIESLQSELLCMQGEDEEYHRWQEELESASLSEETVHE